MKRSLPSQQADNTVAVEERCVEKLQYIARQRASSLRVSSTAMTFVQSAEPRRVPPRQSVDPLSERPGCRSASIHVLNRLRGASARSTLWIQSPRYIQRERDSSEIVARSLVRRLCRAANVRNPVQFENTTRALAATVLANGGASPVSIGAGVPCMR